MTNPEEQNWHAMTVEQTLDAVSSSRSGLSEEEAEERLRSFGPNTIPESPPSTILTVYFRQFGNAFIYLLLIAALVSLVLGELGDAIFIVIALQINAIIGTVQEWNAQARALALRSLVVSTISVNRDGKWQRLDGRHLVPGDIVELESGTRIPAAIRLLASEDLEIDESLLTGESAPVSKNAEILTSPQTTLADRTNVAHAGTTISRGRAMGIVVATGQNTEIGRVAKSLRESEHAAPPLIHRMRAFTHVVAILVVGLITLLAVAQFFRGEDLSIILMTSVALAVAVIPEGLPIALTVALAISVSRMSDRNVVVRKLAAVEGLGACTMIAADKTGTLTINELSVERLCLPSGEESTVSEISSGKHSSDPCLQDDMHDLIWAGMLCNEARSEPQQDGSNAFFGDTVDIAFLRLAEKTYPNFEVLRQNHSPFHRIPYEPAKAFAASFHKEDGETRAFVKGASEVIVDFCEIAKNQQISDRIEELAGSGYRVLALATGLVDGTDEKNLKGLTLLGLAALIDPLRPEAAETIQRCKEAGLEVTMITGDHPMTALEIGRQLGLNAKSEDVTSGSRLAELEHSQPDFDTAVARTTIFARVSPLQKLAIVRSMQRDGHIVAVTGDGINDAAALSNADIGAAMGQSGTDVARGAADLILTDDNLSSLVDGVEEGRIAYGNIRKVIYLLISTGAAELVLFIACLIAGLPLPLSAVQLLWLNLVTQGIQDVALAFERGESGVLDHPPRSTREGIFDRQMIEQTVISGVFIGGSAFAMFQIWLNAGLDPVNASNQLLLALTLFVNVHVFNCRSETRSAFFIALRNNPFLIIGVVAVQITHITAMHTPVLSDVLAIQPLSLEVWARTLLIACSILLVMEAYKWYARNLKEEGQSRFRR